jgi:hypothetical protein
MRAHGRLGAVASTLDTLYDLSLVCLIRLGEFLDALLVSLTVNGQSL